MKRALTIAGLLTALATTALADGLRSDKHLVKIGVQPLSAGSREYNVQVFGAEERKPVAHLKLVTSGNRPAEAETVAGGTQYKVRIDPHGDAYLVAFTAIDGAETVDTMRGGFTLAGKHKPNTPAKPERGGSDVKAPAVLRRIEPVYTDDARAAGAVGTVVLEVVIDKSGFVREATVVKPMGYGLSESAVDAVKQWQFAPSVRERRPVDVLQEVTIDFKP